MTIDTAVRGAVISIHTTAKVVTWSAGYTNAPVMDFNPHHREGGDSAANFLEAFDEISIHTTAKVVTSGTLSNDWEAKFQSTPPRRW